MIDWIYAFCAELCPIFGIDLEPSKHIPVVGKGASLSGLNPPPPVIIHKIVILFYASVFISINICAFETRKA